MDQWIDEIYWSEQIFTGLEKKATNKILKQIYILFIKISKENVRLKKFFIDIKKNFHLIITVILFNWCQFFAI